MSQVNQPEVSLAILPANVAVPNASQQVLFVGQKTSAGSAASGALVQNILDDNSWDGLFGDRSQLAGMIRDARKINKVTQFDAIALDDNGATFATGTLTITGSATEAGVLEVVVGSAKNHTYKVAVADTDSATDIAAAIVAAVTADTKAPVTAANVSGVVTFTAANAGTIGNGITLKTTGTIAGVGFTIVGMAGGATDPVLTSVLDVVGTKRYQTIAWPWADIDVVKDFLDARFNVNNRIQDGIAVTAQTDTLGNLLSTLGALNSASIIYMCDKTTSTDTQKGAAQVELPYSKAAQVSAVRSLRLTDGVDISDIVISANGSLDAFGGPALASKPYFNTNMAQLPLYDIGLGFNETEAEQLGEAGGSIIGNNSANNGVVLGEIFTTYKTDIAGNPDISFHFANYVDTSVNIREYFWNNLKKRFAQSRLTEGDVQAGRDMANDTVISAFLNGKYSDLSKSAFVLTQAGEAALQFFKANKTVTLDMATGTATIIMKTPMVVQLRNIIGTMQIAFTVGEA